MIKKAFKEFLKNVDSKLMKDLVYLETLENAEQDFGSNSPEFKEASRTALIE